MLKHILKVITVIFFSLFTFVNASCAFNFFGDLGRVIDDKKLTIEADNGVEWISETKMYIARGNVQASQGDVTLQANTLKAYYDEASQNAAKVSQLEAEGNVKMNAPEGQLICDHLIYNVHQQNVRAYGKKVTLTHKKFTVTAHKLLEYQQNNKRALFYNHVIIQNGHEKIYADKAIAYFTDISKKLDVERIELTGNVEILSPHGAIYGEKGVFHVKTQTAKMIGKVRLSKDSQSPSKNTSQIEGFVVPQKK